MISCQMHCNCQLARPTYIHTYVRVLVRLLTRFFAFIRFLCFEGKQKLGYQTTGSMHLRSTCNNNKQAHLHVAVRFFIRLAELQCL